MIRNVYHILTLTTKQRQLAEFYCLGADIIEGNLYVSSNDINSKDYFQMTRAEWDTGSP